MRSSRRPARGSSRSARRSEPPSFLPDTSVAIALVCGWHSANASAVTEVGRRLDAGERLVLAGHMLAEAYSVLTRLPQPHRLYPAVATQVLDADLLAHASRVVALDGAGYANLIRAAPARGVSGGRIFDATIAACAVEANVETLLTFNERHFQGLPLGGVRVVVPST